MTNNQTPLGKEVIINAFDDMPPVPVNIIVKKNNEADVLKNLKCIWGKWGSTTGTSWMFTTDIGEYVMLTEDDLISVFIA